jgi:hypothetical protein
MKINRLETHDRLLFYKKEQKDIGDGIQQCINNVPDAITCPFYVYGHSRSVGYDEKKSILINNQKKAPDVRLIWMPVITKPKVEPNTYLFLCRKNTDVINIIWMLPKQELWDQYAPGKLCHNENIWISICNYKYDKSAMNQPDPHGPTEKDILEFRKIMGHEAHKRKRLKETLKLTTSAAFLS